MSHHGKCRVLIFNRVLIRKRTDRLQLNAESVIEWPLYIFQTPLFFLHWKFLPCKANKPQKLK